MHKSDDRGFMIEYNVSTVLFPSFPPALPPPSPLPLAPPPSDLFLTPLLPLSLSFLPPSPTYLIFRPSSSLLPLLSEIAMIINLFMQKLDSGQEYASDAALLPENKAKNRYGNIIACKNNIHCLICFLYDCLDWLTYCTRHFGANMWVSYSVGVGYFADETLQYNVCHQWVWDSCMY